MSRKVWGWVALILLAGCPYSAGAQDILSDVDRIFNQRLETTCHYQEAVLPAGVVGVKRYLQLGKRRYLVESFVGNHQRVIKERYWLEARTNETVPRASRARYELSKGVPNRQGQARFGSFHEYNYQSFINLYAGNIEIYEGFSPAAILALRPDTARTGQTLYVLNLDFDVPGDTLACYELTHVPTGDPWEADSYSMVLRERATRASRQWRHNPQGVYVWQADRTKREVTATRYFGYENGSSDWVRTYATAALTNFTEIHYRTLPFGHAQQRRSTIYRRQFRQLSALQSQDTYTVPSRAGVTPSTFTITSYYSYGKHSGN